MTDVHQIDAREVIVAMRQAVAGKPQGHANTACRYTADDGTHCIAGETLVKLGLVLPESDDNDGDGLNGSRVRLVVGVKGWPIHPDGVAVLAAAQDRADGGGGCVPWTDALRVAERVYRALGD